MANMFGVERYNYRWLSIKSDKISINAGPSNNFFFISYQTIPWPVAPASKLNNSKILSSTGIPRALYVTQSVQNKGDEM